MKQSKIFGQKNSWRVFSTGIFLLLLILIIPNTGTAQYFGRNKPNYRSFDFRVYQSPNFTIYHYFDNDSVINAIANTYEKWYLRHQALFRDTFDKPNPILIYQNHPDFQQTRAIGGLISVGTQGVTEALKNRIVMPVLETNAQTDHVIGHELVHVFHFRALFVDDSLSLNSLRNLPLWMVEGMAEYFSIGSVDANTAMIMRDAVQQDDFPSLRDMTRNYKYNPYRFGHSFIAFIGRTWGDSLIAPLYKETAKFGYERAMERVIGLNANMVSDLWKAAYVNHYKEFVEDSLLHVVRGQSLLNKDNAGRMNIAPSLSPDGRHIAFFSEMDLFTLDLFLADAETGKTIRKLSSSVRDSDIDGFNFLESVGTWSPDGSKFAHVIVKNGRNQIMVVDVNRPRRPREISIRNIPSISNPTWSPDGKYLVFSGLKDGIGNLFLYNMENNRVEQLTNDRYSYIHTQWSPDGKYLTFATDRKTVETPGDSLSFLFHLGLMDMQTRQVEVLDVFLGADNVNPVFDSEQKGIYFLSNRDGFRNLYYYQLEDKKVFQLTRYFTGISGMTSLSPALTVARNTGKIAYSHFKEGNFSVVKATRDDFDFVEVDPTAIDMTAATLPPFIRASKPVVDHFLAKESRTPVFPVDSFSVRNYRPQFGLTYIGSSGVGVSTNRFGTGMAGGVAMMFSDIVGDNQLFTVLAVNGEVYDFGGQVGFVNQKRRISWGAQVSHIPYTFAYFSPIGGVQLGENLVVDDYRFVIQRTFEDQIGLFAYYPFSSTRRLEAGGSMAWYYFRIDVLHNYYQGPFYIGQERKKEKAPPGFNLQRFNLSYVGDNSFFGMASPMNGHRYRFGAEKFFGQIDMYSLTADYRKYFFLKPFSIAMRGIHLGRYGKNAENNLFYPLYLGYPGYVRGYDYSAVYDRQTDFNQSEKAFELLQGSKILMGGLELKIPFTGPERLALIPSNFLFTELAWFLDAGVAWRSGQQVTFDPDKISATRRFPVFSTGPSLRINVFGALILEPFYAFPFDHKGFSKGAWGLNFLPGW